jgi:uncharacterized repeat protein (TIGR01451 family)
VMATSEVTLPTKDRAEERCPCGCAPCEEPCCALDCLVEPRFFCGQLLGDQDLTQLVTWTKDKARLARYRHGWGVVCGLDVRCDAAHPGRVMVGPGYAISCCGDDIIVCEPTPLDLSLACQPVTDPCADLEADRTDLSSAAAEGTSGAQAWPPGGGVAVDVYLRYGEEKAEPQTALGRSVCREVAECEYGRTREVFSLHWETASNGTDPVAGAAKRWHERYERCVDALIRFRGRFDSTAGLGADIRRWLLAWIGDHPLTQFCFVHDRICAMTDEELADEAQLVEVLYWIVQDCRNAYLSCACYECHEGPGVPLARVVLEPPAEGPGACTVLDIDAYPPYRRELAPQCWPAPLGRVNGGRMIWHRWSEACTTLADLGVRVAGTTDFPLPATLAGLESALDCSLFIPCQQPVIAQVFDAGPLGRRLVGFCGGEIIPEPPEIGLTVSKDSDEKEAEPGSRVTYHVTVENTGEAPLTISVTDTLLGQVAPGFRLGAGASRTIDRSFDVPIGATGEMANTVAASGTADDGRLTSATAHHAIQIKEIPLSIEVKKDSKPKREVFEGQGIVYLYRVTNTCQVPLTVDVNDDQAGPVVSGLVLNPGESRQLTARFVVPEGVDTLANQVTATGTAGGRSVTATDRLELRVKPRRMGELSLTKETREKQAEAGQVINYVITVANIGEVDLTVDVEDDRAGNLLASHPMRPGDRERIRARIEVSDDGSGEFVNIATATGVDEEGNPVTATARHSLPLISGEPDRVVESLDDFQVIEGIGPARAERIRSRVGSFRELAALPLRELRDIFPERTVTDEVLKRWKEEALRQSRH